MPDAQSRAAQSRTARSHTAELAFDTAPKSFLDITTDVQAFIAHTRVESGLLTLFIRHTSASLVVQENADPDVRADLVDALDRLAPERAPWRHTTEGPDDMPAHVKAALTATSLTIPVMGGRAALGTWQAIYIAEHRASPQRRSVALHLFG
jgi:secondary thiamine-phosphate synthase enzyme